MTKKKKNQLNLLFQVPIGDIQKPELRPYQLEGVEHMRALISKGFMRIILVCPTGGGKTVIAAHVIDLALQLEKKILFCAHRIELLNQTAKQLARFGVSDIGIVRGEDNRANESAPVQIASIDTLRNRDKPEAHIVFIDECHRSMSDSYRILFALYPDALFIGLTATPFRSDNQGLGEVYQALVPCAKPSQLITDGFIVSPRIFQGELPDIGEVDMSSGTGDYHQGQLVSEMMKPKLLGNVVEEWKKHAEGRRTVVFAVNVEHSQKLCESFRDAGVEAAHIDAKTSIEERNTILLRLEKYEIHVVCNVDVLTEGWDQPSVRCAVLCRPTQSLRMHLQQCGRVIRPYAGDELSGAPTGALILDHAGNCLRHGLPQWDREFDLTQGQYKKEAGPTLHTCEGCYCLWSGSSMTCPECGWVKPAKERKPIQEDQSVALKEIDPKKVISTADQERYFFLKEVSKCREKGMKPGAASYRFKEKYGKWPPYAWKTQTENLFRQDTAWQELVVTRSQTRDHWKSTMAKREQEILVPEGSHKDEGFTQEPEDNYWSGIDKDIPF